MGLKLLKLLKAPLAWLVGIVRAPGDLRRLREQLDAYKVARPLTICIEDVRVGLSDLRDPVGLVYYCNRCFQKEAEHHMLKLRVYAEGEKEPLLSCSGCGAGSRMPLESQIALALPTVFDSFGEALSDLPRELPHPADQRDRIVAQLRKLGA